MMLLYQWLVIFSVIIAIHAMQIEAYVSSNQQGNIIPKTNTGNQILEVSLQERAEISDWFTTYTDFVDQKRFHDKGIFLDLFSYSLKS